MKGEGKVTGRGVQEGLNISCFLQLSWYCLNTEDFVSLTNVSLSMCIHRSLCVLLLLNDMLLLMYYNNY